MSRLADVVIACVLLAMTLPLMMIVALAIKCDSPGPIFRRHDCIGQGGRRFGILEFRTVVEDPQIAPAWNSQRMTRVGYFIHRTRIDALPRLINVLRGEMSLVAADARSPSFLD
jgi:lipopolysaccharide/colanic/teichoic acid biosynthesis glycosyltransferase